MRIGRDPRIGEPLGMTGTWEEFGDGKGGEGYHTREGSHRLALGTLSPIWNGREEKTSGEGRRAVATSRLAVILRPGETGGRSRCKEI